MGIKDYSGQKFGRLMTISFAFKKGRKPYFNFECECGKKKTIRMDGVLAGTTKSCGCISVERSTTHGLYWHPLFEAVKSQMLRCTDPNHPAYPGYGGRGIQFRFASIAEAIKYYETLGPKPSPEHSLDRKENDGHYEPGNVVWSTRTAQNLNQRTQRNKTSKYRGVFWRERDKKWVSQISKKRIHTHLGQFKSEIKAAEIYLEKYFEFYKKWPPEYSKTPLCYKTPLHHLGLIK